MTKMHHPNELIDFIESMPEPRILVDVNYRILAANGAYAFRAKVGDSFQARVVAAPGAAGPLCQQLGSALAPVPCVNPTVNGSTAQTKVVRKK